MKSTALEKIVPQEMHLILLRAADMAVRWWREKKPQSWSIRKHLEAPTINCVGEREKQLARAAPVTTSNSSMKERMRIARRAAAVRK